MRRIVQGVILTVLITAILPVCAAIELNTNELFWLGYKYQQEKNYARAIEFYTEVINKDQNYKNIFAFRGLAYIFGKNYKLALADYLKAVELNPNEAGLYTNLANIYDNLGDSNLAIEYYTKSIEMKDSHVARRQRGKVYFKLKNYDLALVDFSSMDEADKWPYKEEKFICKASLLGFLQRYDECIAEAQSGLQVIPNQPVLLFLIGQSYEKQGNTDAAMNYYRMSYQAQSSNKLPQMMDVKNKIDARLADKWDVYVDWIIAF